MNNLIGNSENRIRNSDQELMQQAVNEPIAKVTGTYDGYFMAASINGAGLPAIGTTLYNEPPKPAWKGLSTAETKVLWNNTKKPSEFAELIEAKLREKNERPA